MLATDAAARRLALNLLRDDAGPLGTVQTPLTQNSETLAMAIVSRIGQVLEAAGDGHHFEPGYSSRMWGFLAVLLPFLFVLTVVVFIHELGHFLVARWCGVKVKAFSIGFGREIFGFYDRRHALARSPGFRSAATSSSWTMRTAPACPRARRWRA